ncbi:HNH endonuclease [Lacticaseibacillus zhaodongensis]|uniref:HNH endonuclease n=1 Tax=Lacticaseibacillus zhaodongensis TaxID=2668065 RepID=UPI001E4A882C|nr:HNH endonuclease [Lacticaseibacillus zhaodongensis]
MRVRINTLPGYENISDNYWISDDGSLLSARRKFKPLKQDRTKPTKRSRNRYLESCLLWKHNRTKKTYVKTHRLVALAFVPNPNNLPQVNHIDQNGLNNRASNLEWVTGKQNSRYSNAKKVYCYDMSGLVKVYGCCADTKADGFNPGHVASVCRGDVAKGMKNPAIRHKGHVFSYKPMDQEEVVQRLSKRPNYKPDNRVVPHHYRKRNQVTK